MVGPAFSPFMYEVVKVDGADAVKIWKWGSFFNALYLGCLPQIGMIISEYARGVNEWKFQPVVSYATSYNVDKFIDVNNTVFKFSYGNIIFATTACVVFFIVTIMTFFNGSILSRCGIHCTLSNCILCPCPNPCLLPSHYSKTKERSENIQPDEETCQIHDQLQNITATTLGENNITLEETAISKTIIYSYYRKTSESPMKKKYLKNTTQHDLEQIPLQVWTNYMLILYNSFKVLLMIYVQERFKMHPLIRLFWFYRNYQMNLLQKHYLMHRTKNQR